MDAIDILLSDGVEPADIAAKFRLKAATIEKHIELCNPSWGAVPRLKEAYKAEMGKQLPECLGNPDEAAEASTIELNISTLSDNIKALYVGVLDVIREAEEDGKHQLRLVAIREARSILEMVMKASPLLLERSGAKDWQAVLGIILKTLVAYPEARKAVSKALDEHKQ